MRTGARELCVRNGLFELRRVAIWEHGWHLNLARRDCYGGLY
jgi:hypothetical protein